MNDEQFDKMMLDIKRADLKQLRGIARLQVINLRIEHSKREKLSREYNALREQERRDLQELQAYRERVRSILNQLTELDDFHE
jgi:hypothetical protein